jgi:nucleotide-binding universal stress UspA family protein
MFDNILACLDGSSLAEKILPLARGIAAAKGGKLTLLRVVADLAEISSEEKYLRDCARQYCAQLSFPVSSDPANAIVAELASNPNAIAALTTHGRTAWAEAILGSVAHRVLGESKRPVLLFRPLEKDGEAPKQITTVVVALDGNEFSEKMIPYAVEAAKSLSAKLLLIEALPLQSPLPPLAAYERSDILESSYLHRKANEIKSAHGISPQWEVLHGEPADAICRYVRGMPETLLAMTSHGRGGLERALLGSVTAACLRHAGVPLLLYWPHH